MGWPSNDADHRLVSAAAMQALEERLFASGLPVAALMEKAALAVSRRLLQDHGERLRRTGALVLVGPGHNGGDGLVVARELHLAGIHTRIWSPFERHKPLTETHRRHALWLGIPELEAEPEPSGEALWIDALLGSGQRRRPGDAIETLLRQRQQQRPRQLLAVDVPTGLCADTGRLTGTDAATALCTHAIGLIKQGLVQDNALAWVGALVRIDLGCPASLVAELPGPPALILWPQDRATAPWPALPVAANKYGRGRLLLAAGSGRYPGAAALAVAGASASGCGSIRAALPSALAEGLWRQAPHLLIEPPLAPATDGSSRLSGLGGGGGTHAGSRDQRLDALLVGPGLGQEPADAGADEDATWDWLQTFSGLLVLDADGLNRLAARQGEGWLRGRQGPTWLTPHRQEFARLFPDLIEATALEAAAIAAARSGAAVLLKGARSLVAAPDGRIWQLGSADARSARTGLGDVLAGYAAGCGARALAALQAKATETAAGCSGRNAPTPPGGRAPGVSPAPAGLDPSLAGLLAAAALEHACAGLKASGERGRAVTPMDVAEALGAGDVRTQCQVEMF